MISWFCLGFVYTWLGLLSELNEQGPPLSKNCASGEI
jgi:hypothetical protein